MIDQFITILDQVSRADPPPGFSWIGKHPSPHNQELGGM